VAVPLGEPVALAASVAEAVAVRVIVGVRVGVAGTVFVGVLVDVLVGVLVSVDVGDSVGVTVGVCVGVGVAGGSTAGQNPPRSVYATRAKVPASGWPIVPPNWYAPPVLNVAPPPSMVLRVRSYPPPLCARLSDARASTRIATAAITRGH
jgi:hypothetical protein